MLSVVVVLEVVLPLSELLGEGILVIDDLFMPFFATSMIALAIAIATTTTTITISVNLFKVFVTSLEHAFWVVLSNQV